MVGALYRGACRTATKKSKKVDKDSFTGTLSV